MVYDNDCNNFCVLLISVFANYTYIWLIKKHISTAPNTAGSVPWMLKNPSSAVLLCVGQDHHLEGGDVIKQWRIWGDEVACYYIRMREVAALRYLPALLGRC